MIRLLSANLRPPAGCKTLEMARMVARAGQSEPQLEVQTPTPTERNSLRSYRLDCCFFEV